jgi:uncharacterized small protein (DUF1192 family)
MRRSGTARKEGSMEEPAEPRRARGQAFAEVLKEDLELYGVEDLEERITQLEGEIARVQAQLERKRAGRAAADAFFKS